MKQLIACIFSRGIGDDWVILPLFLVVVVAGVVSFYWRFFVQWVNGFRGRGWPTVSATIDIVSVIKQEKPTGHGDIVNYLATLTYVYRHPDLQTGDYCRIFGRDEEDDAQAWAASYKGSIVTIHVDPRDPSRSVLRKEEL